METPAPSAPLPAPGAVPHVSPTERKAAREKAGTGDRGPGTGKAVKQAQAQGQEKQEMLFPQGVRSEEPVVYQPSSVAPHGAEDERITRQPMTPIRRRIAERLRSRPPCLPPSMKRI